MPSAFRLNTKRAKSAHVWDAHPQQWYVEPIDCSAALFAAERFIGGVWDPACGGGNIIAGALAAGMRRDEVFASDIVRRARVPGWLGLRDFYTSPGTAPAANIVSNPPYFAGKGAEDFARQALAIATGKIAMFVEVRFLGGDERAGGFYADLRPSRVYIVTPRPSCPPGEYLAAGNRATGGQADYCWIVWDKTVPTPSAPTLHWLHRDR